jgi:UDP-N-acetylmuramoylalanine--D-glutamate ligase
MKNKDVLVIGLGVRARAACELLRRQGARVVAIDADNSELLRKRAEQLRPLGVEVELGVTEPPHRTFSLAVLSPPAPGNQPLVQAVRRNNIPLIGELELGFQLANCLSIAISGTNGKSTTAEMVQRILSLNNRKAILSGHSARPVCSVIEQTKHLDFLILQVNSFQLEMTKFFRPAVAVLMNLPPGDVAGYPHATDYFRANARLFQNQQAFDWAIVQSEALTRLRELDLPVPGKIISFSAIDPRADIRLDRGLILSRLPDWSGPLLDIDHCQVLGPHNAENLMAALAVGHVLRLPLEPIVDALKTFAAGPNRFELIAEINGIQFINDSKAANLDAMQKALLASRTAPSGEPNILLVAGGKDNNLAYHDAGPVLSKRVKRAFLIGESAEKFRAAWSLFIPCTISTTLIKAITEAASQAASGDVVLLSPACSSFDQFRNYQELGEIFCRTVKSISSGVRQTYPNMDDKNAAWSE